MHIETVQELSNPRIAQVGMTCATATASGLRLRGVDPSMSIRSTAH